MAISKIVPGQKVYSASEVLEILGLKKERLRKWIDLNYIGPDVQKASGSGTRNVFSLYNLYQIALFHKLVEAGLKRLVSAHIVNNLDPSEWRQSIRDEGSYLIVVRDTDRYKELRYSTEFIHAKKPPKIDPDSSQIGIVINIKAIAEEVNSKI